MKFIQGNKSDLQLHKRVDEFPIKFDWFYKCTVLSWTQFQIINMIQQAYDQLGLNA